MTWLVLMLAILRTLHEKTAESSDTPGVVHVLGLAITLQDQANVFLTMLAPMILEGFPLAHAVETFEAAAIAWSLRNSDKDWKGLKWLVLFNQVDQAQTLTALQERSKAIIARQREARINPELAPQIAALLLYLGGEEVDAKYANTFDPRYTSLNLRYNENYLAHPGKSTIKLEYRHAATVLDDRDLELFQKIRKMEKFWIDPTLSPPQVFVRAIRTLGNQINVDLLDRGEANGDEDHKFAEHEPILARCTPYLLANIIRRKMHSFHTCPPESRYWVAIGAIKQLLLANESVGCAAHALRNSAARALRNSAHQQDELKEQLAAIRLLILELNGLKTIDQASALVDAALEDLTMELNNFLRPLTPAEADKLIDNVGNGSLSEKRDLLFLFGCDKINLSEAAWSWLIQQGFNENTDLHKFAFRALEKTDAKRFGQELHGRNWAWSAGFDYWVNHYGSAALIAGTMDKPFEQVHKQIAPWRLLEAVNKRGDVGAEIGLAADRIGQILKADINDINEPAGFPLTLVREASKSGQFSIRVRLPQKKNTRKDPFWQAFKNSDEFEHYLEACNQATFIALKHIDEVRQSGANLYYFNIPPSDIQVLIRHAPRHLTDWLAGIDETSKDFVRRVRLAEPTYLALCEALLNDDPARGAALWHSLRRVLQTKFMGKAHVDDMIHIAFRTKDNPATEKIRMELLDLKNCHTDYDLLNISIVATLNGKAGWLTKVIEQDLASELVWKRMRGYVLRGFTANNTLPIDRAWRSGFIWNEIQAMDQTATHFQFREAAARHWWRAYLTSDNPVHAYAAWVTLLQAIDRRAWIWLDTDAHDLDDDSPLFKMKMNHMKINQSEIQEAMNKAEKDLQQQFLGRKIFEGFGPWQLINNIT